MSGQGPLQTHSMMPVYVDTSPYPEVEGGPDVHTAMLLKEDYAGADSELTAITQYVFQNARMTEDEAFANAVLQIAIVEMLHLDMLADAIVTLGGSPRFDDGRQYWGANHVNYAMNMKDILEANITDEKTAITNYEKHSAMTDNVSVKALLARIIEDEKLHQRFFEETLAAMI